MPVTGGSDNTHSWALSISCSLQLSVVIMANKKKPKKPREISPPQTIPEIKPDIDPVEPEIEPDIFPEQEPGESEPPAEIPKPGNCLNCNHQNCVSRTGAKSPALPDSI